MFFIASVSKLKNQELDQLFKAILSLENLDECYMLFEDICTISELQALAQRLHVAKLLRAGVTYQEVCRITGASTATISRVNRCVLYGSGGYQLVLERTENQE